jgi:hypothetical protein
MGYHVLVPFLVWKYIEVVGESAETFADVVKEAVSKAAKTVRGMDWFEVASLGGRITKILHMQAAARYNHILSYSEVIPRRWTHVGECETSVSVFLFSFQGL